MDSGRKINYSLRPSKGIERKIICDLLWETNKVVPVSNSRYIGFGSFYFADFLLFHNTLNIRNMISIEKDENCKKRCEFNKPYSSIEIHEGDAYSVLCKQKWGRKSDIVWLDYDDSFNGTMLNDIEYLINNVANGSIVFVSFNTSIAREGERLNELSKTVGSAYMHGIKEKDLNPKNSSGTCCRIIDISIKKAIDERNSGITKESMKYDARPIAIFKYKDGAPMLTIGFLIATEHKRKRYNKCNFSNYPWFANWEYSNIYEIACPHFTKMELREINKALPLLSEDDEDAIKKLHKKVDFLNVNELKQYVKIYRYYPHYFEALDIV